MSNYFAFVQFEFGRIGLNYPVVFCDFFFRLIEVPCNHLPFNLFIFIFFFFFSFFFSSSFLETCDRFLKEYDILNGSSIIEQHQTKLKKKLAVLQAEEESLLKGKLCCKKTIWYFQKYFYS